MIPEITMIKRWWKGRLTGPREKIQPLGETAYRRGVAYFSEAQQGKRCYGALLWTWLDFFEATIAGVNLPRVKWASTMCPCTVCAPRELTGTYTDRF